MRITIAIAEDNAVERRLLKSEVAGNTNYKLLFDAEDGKDLLFKLQKAKVLPDVLLLDINMPRVNGLIITTYVTFKYPGIKIIGVSSHTNQSLLTEVLSEGAKGFIAKYFLYKESLLYKDHLMGINLLQQAVNSIMQGNIYIDKLVMNEVDKIQLSISTHEIINTKYPYFKPKLVEFAILNASGLTHEEIAALMCLSVAAIKKYCTNLMAEFMAGDRFELGVQCMQRGIVKLAVYYDKSIAA